MIVRPGTAVRLSLVTENLKGRDHLELWYINIFSLHIYKFDLGISTSHILHLIMTNFHYIGKKKIIIYYILVLFIFGSILDDSNISTFRYRCLQWTDCLAGLTPGTKFLFRISSRDQMSQFRKYLLRNAWVIRKWTLPTQSFIH